MSDYTKNYDWTAKDSLASGDPDKIIKGAEFDDEFDAIVTAIATKYDSADRGAANGIASLDASTLVPAAQLPAATESAQGAVELATTAEVVTGTDTARAVTAAGVEAWSAQNGGIVQDLSNLADPNADRILFWDDSAGAAALLTVSTGLSISGTNLTTNDSGISHDNLSGFVANEHIDHSSVSITAGNGLTGGGTIAATRTLDVGAGDGISVTANAVAVDSTVVRTTGIQTIGGAKTFSDDTVLQGDIEVQDQVKFTGVITDDIGSSTGENNYNPTGFTNATIVRVVHTATCAITGMAGGTDGRIVILANVDDDDTHGINFTEESGSSTAANRFTVAGTIGPGESTAFWYDGTSSRWRPITGV